MKFEIQNRNYLHKIIERGIIFLLIFTPLAFGTVQPWSVSIMEITAFVIFGAWLVSLMGENKTAAEKTPLLYFLGGMVVLAVFQLVPMPQGLLAFLSPSTSVLYTQFAPQMDGSWHTLSIHPDATKEELYKLIAYAVVFVVIINHYRTRDQIRSIIYPIIFMGCFLAVFAVLQKMTWNGKLYWIYPVAIISNTDSIWGPYINHNHFAGYLEMAIAVALGLLLYTASKVNARSKKSFLEKILHIASKKEVLTLALLFVAVLIMSGALFLSLSRGGIIGFTAGVVLFGLMIRRRRSLRKKTGVIAITGFAIIMTVVVASWERIENRFEDIGKAEKIKRTDVWKDSLTIIREFPVLGSGLGTFSKIYPKYQSNSPNVLFRHAENDYIEILADTGILGFCIIAGLLAAFFITILKAWKDRHSGFVLAVTTGGLSSCFAIAVHSLTDFNTRIPANALTLSVIAGITYATVHHVKNGTFKERNVTNDEEHEPGHEVQV